MDVYVYLNEFKYKKASTKIEAQKQITDYMIIFLIVISAGLEPTTL